MTLRFADNAITSDVVNARAQRWENSDRIGVAEGQPEFFWTVTGWTDEHSQDRIFDRNQAITAMTILEEQATGGDPDLIASLMAEL